MPSWMTSGCSTETSREMIGFSQIERPTPWPNWSANAASSLGKPNSCAFGQTETTSSVRDAGADLRDRRVEDVAAALVGVDERRRRAADRERAVVAGAVAHVGVEDVEVGRVAGTQHAVGVDVRVRRAALAGDRVDALDVLGAEVVEHLADEPDALVLAHPGPHLAVELLVGGVDHHAGRVEQRDLVARLDHARLLHQLLAVDDLDPLALEREQHRPARRRRRRPAPPSRPRCSSEQADLRRDVLGAPRLAATSRRASSRSRRASGPRATGSRSRGGAPPSRSPTSIGSSSCGSRQKRASLSIAHVPMCVAVM